MRSWLDKIKQGQLWRYQGGVHPATKKDNIDCGKPETLTLAKQLVVPLQQHIGSPAKVCVEVGSTVKTGQALTESRFYQSPPVHAPCCGTVVAIEARPSAHPSGINELAVVIEPSSIQEENAFMAPLLEAELTPELICERVHQAGISGMGGAGFPAALKILPNKPLDVLIINGAECEPYISSDDCLMRNYAEPLLRGVSLLEKALSPKLVIVAVEDDKPEAIKALQAAAGDNIVVRAIPTKYPSGGEKQLVQVLTGRELKAGQLPIDQGILVHNVGTAYAVQRAVDHGEPLISRIVTLAGDHVGEPRNYWVAIGTPVSHLLEQQKLGTHHQAIMGGSMMGFMLPNLASPIVKTANCILVNNTPAQAQEQACIRCGECAQACPMGLLPQQLYWYAKGDDLEKSRSYKLMDCIECGACAYVCPSAIPLVQYYRQTKAKVRAEDLLAQEAERAKQRFDARKLRLEKEQAERKARQKQAAERRLQQAQGAGNDPVKAALQRMQNKQVEIKAIENEQGELVPDNSAAIAARKARKAQARAAKDAKTTNPAVAAALARAKAKRDGDSEQSAPVKSDNPAVAAAIARAKAKRNSEQTPEAEGSKPATSANPAVAAAIARAKAKKAQQTGESEPDNTAEKPSSTSSNPAVVAAIARAKAKNQAAEQPSANAKDAAVAAAVARAKAKKASQREQPELERPENAASKPASSANPAVAAAIARAKAKKAQAEQQAQGENAVAKPAKSSANPAVAAAIASAKAKKLAQEQQQQTQNEHSEDARSVASSDSPVEPADATSPPKRSAAVAKAIAAAKAKQAAKAASSMESDNDE